MHCATTKIITDILVKEKICVFGIQFAIKCSEYINCQPPRDHDSRDQYLILYTFLHWSYSEQYSSTLIFSDKPFGGKSLCFRWAYGLYSVVVIARILLAQKYVLQKPQTHVLNAHAIEIISLNIR